MTRRSAWWGTALATLLVVGPCVALVWLAVSGFSRQEEAVREAVLSGLRDLSRARAEAAAQETLSAAEEALGAVAPPDAKDVLQRLRSTSRRPDLVEEYFLASPEGDILYPGDLGGSQPQMLAYEERPEDAAGRRLLADARLLERTDGKRAEARQVFERLASVAYGRTLRGEALADLAAFHFKGKEFDEAVGTYRRLLSELPAGFVEPAVRVLARFQIGASLEAAGQTAEAEAEYRAMLADALGEEPSIPGVPATRWFVSQALARLRAMQGAGALSAQGKEGLEAFERLARAKLRPGGIVDALRSWVLPAIRRQGLSIGAVRGVLDVRSGRPTVVLYRGVREGGRDLALGFVARLDRLSTIVGPRLGAGDGVAFALDAGALRLVGPAGDAAARAPAPAPLDFADVVATPTSEQTVEGPVRRQRLLGRLLLGLLALVLGAGVAATLRGRAQAHRFARLQADFVARVSHDLKTPLALIRLYAETLLRPECDRAKGEEYHRVIARESERLTHMVNNLLDFSRVQEGKRVYHRQPADLVRVVREAAEAIRPRFAEDGFSLEVDLPKGEVVAAVDADAVTSAVVNLLDNARKYSGEARQVRLSLLAEPDRARIEVLDRGIGVPAEERERVFERFHRGSDPRVRDQKGAGLGLALVRHVAEGHGGRAWLAPNGAQGTVANVELPR
ncbi:MAG: HAMP domain-containing sensor histidine kinase [Planctomycetota bacterium]|mgnify:CR=1 FL=1